MALKETGQVTHLAAAIQGISRHRKSSRQGCNRQKTPGNPEILTVVAVIPLRQQVPQEVVQVVDSRTDEIKVPDALSGYFVAHTGSVRPARTDSHQVKVDEEGSWALIAPATIDC